MTSIGSTRHVRFVAVRAGVLVALMLCLTGLYTCMLPPPQSQTPAPCSFQGCAANQMRVCQDQCVTARSVGESCTQYIDCSVDPLEICAPGLTCVSGYGTTLGFLKLAFECQPAKPVGGICYPDPNPVCPARDPCPAGQYCRAISVPYSPHQDPRTVAYIPGRCTDEPKQGELCAPYACQECEGGLECIDGTCQRRCTGSDDCPCEGAARLCCGGICQRTESSWHALQQAVFQNGGCLGCHAGAKPDGNLNLEPAHAYANLFNAPSSIDPAWSRIKSPGKEADSVLYLKLAAKTYGTALPSGVGNPMPFGSAAMVNDATLKALAAWINAGAPETGLVPGTEQLSLGCLTPTPTLTAGIVAPTPTPTPVCPDAPAAGVGARLYAPPWLLGAPTPPALTAEREVCYATYYDLSVNPATVPAAARMSCPAPLNQSASTCVRTDESDFTQTPNFSHHSIIYFYSGTSTVTDASWGTWRCLGGAHQGTPCVPTAIGIAAPTGADCGDRSACAAANWTCDDGTACDPAGAPCAVGRCQMAYTFNCDTYGPNDFHTARLIIGGGQTTHDHVTLPTDVFSIMPIRGLIVWDSHAKNASTEDARIEQCYDVGFADPTDQYLVQLVFDAGGIPGLNIPPFESREYCRNYTFPQNAHVFQVNSHMHKRGQSFTVWGPPQSPCATDNSGCASPPTPPPGMTAPQPTPTIYLNTDWAEPKPADPQLCLDNTDRSTRTIRYCADYFNGMSANADVKRKSTSPLACTPTKCVAGLVGNTCTDDTFCANVPGACDACPVKGGFTTDDEMMILLGLYYSKPACP